MEWSREKTVSLIQEYRKRRGLWDLTHDDYRKKDIKHKLLEEVSNSLGADITITEIEKKFHTLRTQFQREINATKRREPYNSKWFAFKHLQFLNSPRACRSAKGRLKTEITEDGTVATNFIIRESPPPAPHEMADPLNVNAGLQAHNGGVEGITVNDAKEYNIALHRATNAVTMNNGTTVTGSTGVSRTHELEKLIEETTKEVDDIEDNKNNINLKDIAVPLEHQHQHHQPHHQDQEQQHHQLHHHHHHHNAYGSAELQIGNLPGGETHEVHHLQAINGNNMDAINMHSGGEGEITYHQVATSTGPAGCSGIGVTTVVSNTTATMHTIPARIIKIQRRDPTHGENVEPIYDTTGGTHFSQSNHHQQQQATHHSGIQTTVLSQPNAAAAKRIYYDANGTPHTATILTATTTNPGQAATVSGTSLTLLNATAAAAAAASAAAHGGNSSDPTTLAASKLQLSSNLTNAGASFTKDEFSIYGDYVASEMRTIKTREVLISLKHKINNAIFEASMTELQK